MRSACFAALATLAVIASASPGRAQTPTLGTITGHVALTGPHPGNPLIRMGMDPMCAAANKGRPVQEIVTVAANGSVANVFVRLDGVFPKTPVPKDPVVVDQRACLYVPRVVGVRVGQTLQVRNSDDILHNAHGLSSKGNAFNVSEPKAGMVQSFVMKGDETMLRVTCDIHRWMRTFVGVVSHPYFAVSGADGTFRIANVPPGSYTIVAWQERYGLVSQAVRVRPGSTTTVAFSYTGKETPAPQP